MEQSFVSDLATYIRAGYPILYVVTSEEDRAIDLLDELGQMKAWKEPRRLHLWSISRGFVDLEGKKIGQEDSTRQEQALLFLRKARDPGLFVLKDFHPYLKDKAQNASLIIRMLRDLAPELIKSGLMPQGVLFLIIWERNQYAPRPRKTRTTAKIGMR